MNYGRGQQMRGLENWPENGMNRGGMVPGEGRGDKVPTLLEPGELVVPRDKVSNVLNQYPELAKAPRDHFSWPEGMQEGGVVRRTYDKNLHGVTPVEYNTDDPEMLRSIFSVPASQVGGGEGLRYYSSEIPSGRPHDLDRRVARLYAMNKMATAPQDSIPYDMIEDYYSEPPPKKGKWGANLRKKLGMQEGGVVQDMSKEDKMNRYGKILHTLAQKYGGDTSNYTPQGGYTEDYYMENTGALPDTVSFEDPGNYFFRFPGGGTEQGRGAPPLEHHLDRTMEAAGVNQFEQMDWNQKLSKVSPYGMQEGGIVPNRPPLVQNEYGHKYGPGRSSWIEQNMQKYRDSHRNNYQAQPEMNHNQGFGERWPRPPRRDEYENPQLPKQREYQLAPNRPLPSFDEWKVNRDRSGDQFDQRGFLQQKAREEQQQQLQQLQQLQQQQKASTRGVGRGLRMHHGGVVPEKETIAEPFVKRDEYDISGDTPGFKSGKYWIKGTGYVDVGSPEHSAHLASSEVPQLTEAPKKGTPEYERRMNEYRTMRDAKVEYQMRPTDIFGQGGSENWPVSAGDAPWQKEMATNRTDGPSRFPSVSTPDYRIKGFRR